MIGNLRGAPIRSKFVPYDPVEDVNKAPRCAYQLFKGTKNLVEIPKITH